MSTSAAFAGYAYYSTDGDGFVYSLVSQDSVAPTAASLNTSAIVVVVNSSVTAANFFSFLFLLVGSVLMLGLLTAVTAAYCCRRTVLKLAETYWRLQYVYAEVGDAFVREMQERASSPSDSSPARQRPRSKSANDTHDRDAPPAAAGGNRSRNNSFCGPPMQRQGSMLSSRQGPPGLPPHPMMMMPSPGNVLPLHPPPFQPAPVPARMTPFGMNPAAGSSFRQSPGSTGDFNYNFDYNFSQPTTPPPVPTVHTFNAPRVISRAPSRSQSTTPGIQDGNASGVRVPSHPPPQPQPEPQTRVSNRSSITPQPPAAPEQPPPRAPSATPEPQLRRRESKVRFMGV